MFLQFLNNKNKCLTEIFLLMKGAYVFIESFFWDLFDWCAIATLIKYVSAHSYRAVRKDELS